MEPGGKVTDVVEGAVVAGTTNPAAAAQKEQAADAAATSSSNSEKPVTISIDDEKETDEEEVAEAAAKATSTTTTTTSSSSSSTNTDNNNTHDETEKKAAEEEEAEKKDAKKGKQKERTSPRIAAAAVATTTAAVAEEEKEMDTDDAKLSRKRTLRVSSVCPSIKNGDLKPYIGMKFQKLFEDNEYYAGSIVSGPEIFENDFGEMEPIWHVVYEDGDEEDLSLDELKDCKFEDNNSSSSSNKKSKSESKSSKALEEKTAAFIAKKQYEKAKEALCSLPSYREDEVIVALDVVGAPYGMQEVTLVIHKNRDSNNIAEPSSGLFNPEIGLRIRKLFNGKAWLGTVTKDAEYVEEPSEIEGEKPREIKMWQVTYDDGDVDDMTWQELFQHRADRPIRNSTFRGRVLQSLELFSGCGVVTQEFVKRNWAVCSIDNDPSSNAIIKQDIMKIKPKDLEFIPDFIWASPPCFTYSNMSGGKHRKVAEGKYEITEEARQNNFFFTRMWEIMEYCKKLHPHLIVCIENPVGSMSKMPLMKEMVDSFGLYRSQVNYCALGREDKKPTMIWTNDYGLHCRLNEFKCAKGRCPYYEGSHPISCRQHGNRFNGAAIPDALAEEVSQYVDSKFYMDRIPYTKSAPPPSWEQTGQTTCWRDYKPLISGVGTEDAGAETSTETSTTAASTASAVDSATAAGLDDDDAPDDDNSGTTRGTAKSSINEVVVVD